MRSQKTWVLSVPLVLALSFGSLAWSAQESETKAKGGDAVSVTGCLHKGTEAGEYAITGDDGRKYELHSKSVDLSKHLGHKVTVTGTKMREENEQKEKHQAAGGEYADLRVTNVKHISESCQQ
jgi:maltose-binding protein MalE